MFVDIRLRTTLTNRPLADSSLSQRKQPSFGIYPGATLDTYIYERSISSKSDNYATNSPDTPFESEFSASTFISSALSSDSTETLQSTLDMDGVPHLSQSNPTSLSTQPSYPEQPSSVARDQPIPSRVTNNNLDKIVPPRSFESFTRAPILTSSSLPPSSDMGIVSSNGYSTESAGASINRSSTPFARSRSSTSAEEDEDVVHVTSGIGQRKKAAPLAGFGRGGYDEDNTSSLSPESVAFADGYESAQSFPTAETEYGTDDWRDVAPAASYSTSHDSLYETNNVNSASNNAYRGRENPRPLPVPPCGPRDADLEQWPKKMKSRPPGLAVETQALPNATENSSHPPPSQNPAKSTSANQRLSISIPKRLSPPISDHGHRFTTTTTRCVRWNENLICPSPILPSQRRKGWFNRKGWACLTALVDNG
jgi:hypothetical protein